MDRVAPVSVVKVTFTPSISPPHKCNRFVSVFDELQSFTFLRYEDKRLLYLDFHSTVWQSHQ